MPRRIPQPTFCPSPKEGVPWLVPSGPASPNPSFSSSHGSLVISPLDPSEPPVRLSGEGPAPHRLCCHYTRCISATAPTWMLSSDLPHTRFLLPSASSPSQKCHRPWTEPQNSSLLYKLASSVSLEFLKGRNHTPYFSESPAWQNPAYCQTEASPPPCSNLWVPPSRTLRGAAMPHTLSPDCAAAPVPGAAVLLLREKAFRVHQKNLTQSGPQSISQEKSRLHM